MFTNSYALACCVLMTVAVLLVPTNSADDTYAGWEPAVLIESNDIQTTSSHDVAIDAFGNAIAVWRHFDGLSYKIWANRYAKGLGWGEAFSISEPRTQMGGPSVAMSSTGNGVVAWSQYDDDTSTLNVVMNYYEAGTGWSGATKVEEVDDGHAWEPDVAADSLGDFFIIWYQSDGVLYDALCRKYSPDSGLGDLWVLDDSETEDVIFTRIGTDAHGGAVAVWKQGISPPYSVVSCIYEPGSGWGAPEVIDYDHISNGVPVLSVEPGGNATCAWQNMETYYEIWANHYSVGSGWETSSALRVHLSANAMYPSVASIGCGRSLVAWHEWGVGTWEGICAVERSTSGWGTVDIAVHADDGLASNPSLASSFDNDAIMVFSIGLNDMCSEIWAIPYTSEQGWGRQEKISEPDLGGANYPLICANGAGDATAVWQQSSGVNTNMWAACRPGPDLIPPVLSISSPSDGEAVESQVVTVEGITEAGANLVVNGILAYVESDGSFSLELPLQEGENTILAVATDSSGNAASASITVTYVVPPNPLDDDLEEALDTIDQIWNELNESMEDMGSAMDEITSSLEEIREDLNDTLNDLSEAEGDLTNAEEQLEDADSRIDTLSSRVSLVTALLVVVALLLGLVSVMYLQLRKSLHKENRTVSEPEPPPQE